MKTLRLSLSLALTCAVLASGCGDDDRPARDSGIIADTGPRPDGGGGGDAGMDSGGGDPCDGVDCSGLDDMCNMGECNPDTGACEAKARPDGTACASLCNEAGECSAGVCSGTPTVDCSAMDDMCNVGVCVESDGSCTAMPRADGTECEDEDACTLGDVCTAGACAGTALDCSPMADGCNTAACDPTSGTCVVTPVADDTACDDANGCTTGDHCTAGACGGTGLDCSGMTSGCMVGVCDPATVTCSAMVAPDGTSCNDSNACTTADTCMAGACGGTPLTHCNAVCSLATAVTSGSVVPAQDTTAGIDNLTFGSCGSSLYHALYYTISVPAGQGLTVTATPLSSWNPVIRLLPSCGATTCLSTANATTTGPETLFYANSGASAQPVTIAVGSASSTTFGAFDLTASLGPAPANRVCGSAIAVTNGTRLTNQAGGFGSDDLTFTCGTGSDYDVLYYSVTVPAGQALIARATPTSSWNPVMRLLPACGAGACLASATSGGSGAAEELVYVNSGAAAQPAVIAVGASSAGASGVFDLSVDLVAPPPNRICGSAIALTDGLNLTGQVQQLGVDDLTIGGCGTNTYDNLYYSATLAPGERLIVGVVPNGSWNPNIKLLTGCATSACWSFAEASSTGAAEVADYTNITSSPQTVIVAVGSSSATAGGTFDLFARRGTSFPPA